MIHIYIYIYLSVYIRIFMICMYIYMYIHIDMYVKDLEAMSRGDVDIACRHRIYIEPMSTADVKCVYSRCQVSTYRLLAGKMLKSL